MIVSAISTLYSSLSYDSYSSCWWQACAFPEVPQAMSSSAQAVSQSSWACKVITALCPIHECKMPIIDWQERMWHFILRQENNVRSMFNICSICSCCFFFTSYEPTKCVLLCLPMCIHALRLYFSIYNLTLIYISIISIIQYNNLFFWYSFFFSVVNCTEPGHVENSVRQVLPSGPQRYSFQTTVSYTCNPGYYLLGTSTLTCQGDGTWDRSLPKCLCELLACFCTICIFNP